MISSGLQTAVFDYLSGSAHIGSAFLLGSRGRETSDFFADLDIALLVAPIFDAEAWAEDFAKKLKNQMKLRYKAVSAHKIVFYGEEFIKLDLMFTTNRANFEHIVMISGIADLTPNIIADKQGVLKTFKAKKQTQALTEVKKYLSEFVIAYESASNSQSAGDGYRFYFHYNTALHALVQMKQLLSQTNPQEHVLPKNFIFSTLPNEEIPSFLDMNGVTHLAHANEKKRQLLSFFYDTLALAESQNLLTTSLRHSTVNFCESVYERDFFWNFRDISLINPRLKSGLIFRTSSLTRYQNLEQFEKFVRDRNILRAIDLRSYPEVEQQPYSPESQEFIEHIHVPMDHRKHMEAFRAENMHGHAMTHAYRFFMYDCKQQVKAALAVLADHPPGATAIHCFAGKDRTGIIISLLHLISGASEELAKTDYLASRMDTSPTLFAIFIDAIRDSGGLEPYLNSCGLEPAQIAAIKAYILK